MALFEDAVKVSRETPKDEHHETTVRRAIARLEEKHDERLSEADVRLVLNAWRKGG